MADQEDQTLQQLHYVENFGGTAMSGDLDDMGPEGGRRFFGKYRGTVMANVDPNGQGRLLVQVPDVFGLFVSSWAMPCVPVGGIQMGMFLVPPLYSGVWVEFEQGNPEWPIWVGSFWGSRAEAPATSNLATPGMPVMILQSAGQQGIIISDTPVPPLTSGVMLFSTVAVMTVDKTGVTITAPTIKLNGAVTITGAVNITGTTNINGGALLVS
jgi:hypothetical protein